MTNYTSSVNPHCGLDTATRADVDREPAEDSKSFTDQLLQALATMAVRSKRRQSDLSAALARANLDTDPHRVTEALRQLEKSGCIEHLVPLYDGGVLMSVTSRGVESLSAAPRWTMLDGAGLLRG
jgi:DNA-binding MarR family transcriptional regulator